MELQAWKKVDQILTDKNNKTLEKLAENGIGEGDMDDESCEGQIWQMVEGRQPYTLDMV